VILFIRLKQEALDLECFERNYKSAMHNNLSFTFCAHIDGVSNIAFEIIRRAFFFTGSRKSGIETAIQVTMSYHYHTFYANGISRQHYTYNRDQKSANVQYF